jgi:hypothetical protein
LKGVEFSIPIRFLARAFVDTSGVLAGQEQGLALSKALGGDSPLVPQIGFERTADGLAHARNILTAQDMQWHISVIGEGVNVARLSTALRGQNLGDFVSFARSASQLLIAALRHLQRQAHRLSLVQEGYLERSSEDMRVIAPRLLRMPPSFEVTPPFEWDWRGGRRGALRVGGSKEEETNVFVTVRRHVVIITDPRGPEQLELDGLRVDFDVNTIGENIEPRFGEAEVREFFELAVQEHARLDAEFVPILRGGRA